MSLRSRCRCWSPTCPSIWPRGRIPSPGSCRMGVVWASFAPRGASPTGLRRSSPAPSDPRQPTWSAAVPRATPTAAVPQLYRKRLKLMISWSQWRRAPVAPAGATSGAPTPLFPLFSFLVPLFYVRQDGFAQRQHQPVRPGEEGGRLHRVEQIEVFEAERPQPRQVRLRGRGRRDGERRREVGERPPTIVERGADP